MGGNDTHDKYGRPYELDDGVEKLYDKLEDAREEIHVLKSKIEEFSLYLEKEIEECDSPSAINIEMAQTLEIQKNFVEIFNWV